GGDRRGPVEHRERARVVAERGVSRSEPKRRVEVVAVRRQDLLEERDRLGVLRAHEQEGRALDYVEERAHVDGPRSVLADDGRRARADVAEARELAALVLVERLDGRGGRRLRDRIVEERGPLCA